MMPQPLHPAVVHFPIVLAVLLPVVAITALVLIERGGNACASWLPVCVLALSLAGSAWVAVQTGESEEEVVEEVVARSAIHDHEEAAELFMPLSFGVFLLIGLGLLRGRAGQVARSAGAAAAIVLLVAGYPVAETGGELVYEYDAASAYTSELEGGTREDDRRDHAEEGEEDDSQDDDEEQEKD